MALDYADVLLPISPFTETAGTFVNCEGRAQSFNGTVKPLGETRPAWKVLRVLGNLLDLQGFNYETSEAIRNEVLGVPSNTRDVQADLRPRLNNQATLAPKAAAAPAGGGLERLAPTCLSIRPTPSCAARRRCSRPRMRKRRWPGCPRRSRKSWSSSKATW